MKLLFVFFLLFFVFVLAAPAGGKKPMILRTKQRRWLADDLKQYHAQMRKTHKDYIPLYPDLPITADISIGTPPVVYDVSMESGSEATFVLAKNYPGRNVSNWQPFFDPAQSSTARAAGDYAAFSGNLEVFGEAYDDVVGLIDPWLWPNTTQRFGVVDRIRDPYLENPEMPDGVVGLSWDPADAANPNENSSAIINFFRVTGYERFWCHWLEIFTLLGGREGIGSIQFGGCLDDKCQPATPENTFPLVWLEDSRSLAFTVDSFTYKTRHFIGGYGKADTGVPNILVPFDAMLVLYDDVDPYFDFDHFLYTVDCNRAGELPDWTFAIGGKNYTIPSTSYVVDLLLPRGQCALSAYYSDTATTDYVFGYVFHQLWCIKMDVENQAVSLMDTIPQPYPQPAVEQK